MPQQSEGFERRQVFDIPPVQFVVTEHQAEIKDCTQCGERVKAQFPDEVKGPVQYGPGFQAQVAYWSGYQLLPVARICEAFGDVYGHAPSEGSVLRALDAGVGAIQPTLGEIEAHLKDAEVLHADETSMRVGVKSHWLHVLCTESATRYGVHASRGQKGMRELGLLPECSGVVVHDGLRSYFTFDNVEHALCNAHHLRELIFIDERDGHWWANVMAELLCQIKQFVDEAQAAGETTLDEERLRIFAAYYDALIVIGSLANPPPADGSRKNTKERNLLLRLQRDKDQVLAFAYDFRIPFDNNLAERDLRMMKTKQKVSGCFRTLQGAQHFCDLRSYISTARKQGLSVLAALRDALAGRPFSLSNA